MVMSLTESHCLQMICILYETNTIEDVVMELELETSVLSSSINGSG